MSKRDDDFEKLVAGLERFISPDDAAKLLGYPRSTLDAWASDGHLDGCWRKRGKHVRYITRRLVKWFFDGKDM